jgi:hypothetical protein
MSHADHPQLLPVFIDTQGIMVIIGPIDAAKLHGHASYNVAKKVLAFVYQVAIPRSHLRASYGDGFLGAPLRCTPRQEEGSFTRGSGVCDEQAFSQENQDRGGADHV